MRLVWVETRLPLAADFDTWILDEFSCVPDINSILIRLQRDLHIATCAREVVQGVAARRLQGVVSVDDGRGPEHASALAERQFEPVLKDKIANGNRIGPDQRSS